MHLADYMGGMNPNGQRFSDEEVAAAINRSRATVSRIRRRKVRPDWETIEAITAFTGGLVTATDFQNMRVSTHQTEAVE